MFKKFGRFFSGNHLRKPSVLVVVFAACFAFWYVDLWRPFNSAKKQNQFAWDVMHYYSYLPATFCYDGSFDFFNSPDSLFLEYSPFGRQVPKTTYGMALLYSPFFAIGYVAAYIDGSSLNGFSQPFSKSVRWGSILFILAGLYFLRKFLLVYFSEMVTAITLFIVLFGTMLFEYTYSDSEYSHGYLATLFSAFLLVTQRWHNRQTYTRSVLAGLLLGLVVLIRPTELYIFLFFIFWNVRTVSDARQKFRFLRGRWRHLLVILVLCILYWIPQIIFWKQHLGSYFQLYKGERFFWSEPQIFNILFSYRKGWITYTPLVVLCFIGMFGVKKEIPLRGWLFGFNTVVLVYVLSCWWTWFFGGSFGARAFCQYIVILSIPLASVVERIFYPGRAYAFQGLVTLVSVLFIFSCVCLNIGQSYQYAVAKKLHYDSMTKTLYWDLLRTYQFPDNYEYWGNLDPPDYEELLRGEGRDK